MIPAEHRAFLDRLLAEHGLPGLEADERARLRAELAAARGGMTPEGARRLLAVALTHPQITMVVSALGIPPADVTADLRERGIAVGAVTKQTTVGEVVYRLQEQYGEAMERPIGLVDAQ